MWDRPIVQISSEYFMKVGLGQSCKYILLTISCEWHFMIRYSRRHSSNKLPHLALYLLSKLLLDWVQGSAFSFFRVLFFFFQSPDWSINGTLKNTTTPATFRSLKMTKVFAVSRIQCSVAFAHLVGAHRVRCTHRTRTKCRSFADLQIIYSK